MESDAVYLPYLVVCGTAFGAAALTLYSGFGLGTLLLPVLALFFPVEVAVAATAVVHGANNVFKVSLLGRHADRELVLRFGVPAILAAALGALMLGWFATLDPLMTYTVAGREATVTPIKLVMGWLMLFFAGFELLPGLREIRFGREHLVMGGVLSGFFGGLSGHQGALRSAYLVKAGLTTQQFVGTSSVIGLMVDAMRVVVYGALMFVAGQILPLGREEWTLVGAAVLAAFSGVLVGKRFLHKVTIGAVQVLTGALLFVIAILLGSGLI
jgi:uncharacterized membrane protein YfcA